MVVGKVASDFLGVERPSFAGDGLDVDGVLRLVDKTFAAFVRRISPG